ncbi:hypothetical protein ONE63_001270 [Megalurothrips usitatus]|uniref:Gustatory receptor n=1 Tax=Megalurothrips usitatus TaxID=439358 RepID=A0AAV7XDM2_9NEOP|nr:hypothetical protein ONE63_001270 [Megalurothrips usitatus]
MALATPPRRHVDKSAFLPAAATPTAPTGKPRGSGASSFLKGLKPAATLAQWFSLLPVAKPADDQEATFRWKSFRFAYAVVVIIGSFVESIFSLLRMFETGVTFYTSVNVMFYTTSIVTSVVFVKMSLEWRDKFSYWSRVEQELSALNGEPPRLVANMVIMTTVVIVLAAVEHILSIVSTLVQMYPCYDRGGLYLLIEGYYLMKYRKLFTVVRFSMTRAVILFVLQIITTFIWNFCDLFVILLSMGLGALLRQLNRGMNNSKGKVLLEEYWRKKREAYNNLAILTRTMGDYVGPLVLISYASNLYFICLQLLLVTKRTEKSTSLHNAYFFFSFSYLVGRTLAMSLLAADVSVESQNPKPALFCVPPASYCSEVRRFLMQVNTDSIAITGCNFFSVTRSFILTVAGTIVTYMVILVQFDSASDGERDHHNSTVVACTCSDLKIYDC